MWSHIVDVHSEQKLNNHFLPTPKFRFISKFWKKLSLRMPRSTAGLAYKPIRIVNTKRMSHNFCPKPEDQSEAPSFFAAFACWAVGHKSQQMEKKS